jgi:glycerol uptake facilitator-like aquaporin
MNSNLRASLAELIGTFAVVFFTSAAVVANGIPSLSGQAGYGKIGIALVAGASWAVALALTLRLSGGFLNPAMTITLWAFQRIEHKRAAHFLIAQLIGGVLAGLAIRGLFFFSENALLSTRMGTPHLNLAAFATTGMDQSTMIAGIAIETLLSFLLVFAMFAFIFDSRFRRNAGESVYRLSYLWIGLLIFAETMIAFSYTSACLNPARWLGLVIWESTVAGLQAQHPWTDHAPFWIGPTLGSVLAGLIYNYVILPADERKGPPKELP